MTPRLATLALGANMDSQAGAPPATLAAAITRLQQVGVLHALSSLWLTPPVGFTEQPWFHNAVLQIATDWEPERILATLQRLEAEFGRDRTRTVRNGPRPLDLDLLLVGDRILETPQLVLPHPRMTERAFVMLPLAEIAPELRHPVTLRSVAEDLAALPESERLACIRKPMPWDVSMKA